MFYKSTLLSEHRIFYPKNVPYLEDGLFLGKVFSIAKNVAYSNLDFYQRTTRPGSATNSDLFYNEKALNGFKNAIVDWLDFYKNLKKINYQEQCDTLFNHVLAKFVFLCFTTLRKRNDFDVFHEFYVSLQMQGIKKLHNHGVSGVYRKLIPYYNASPKLLYYIIPYHGAIYNRFKV